MASTELQENGTKNTASDNGRFSPRDINSVPQDISDFVDDTVTNNKNSDIEISLATQMDERIINSFGNPWKDAYKGTLRTYSSDYVRHALKNHNDPVIEALRGQLHLDKNAIKIALANLRAGKGRPIKGTYTGKGLPSVLVEIPINGYTLYAEEPMQLLRSRELQGRTIYVAPTSPRTLIQNGSANISRRQSRGYSRSISAKSRIVNDKLTESNGDVSELYFLEANGKAYAGNNTQGLYILSKSTDNLAKYSKGKDIKKATVNIQNPYLVSMANPIITKEDNETGKILDRVAEIKAKGYDAIIMDYAPEDNHIVLTFDASSIIPKAKNDKQNNPGQASEREYEGGANSSRA